MKKCSKCKEEKIESLFSKSAACKKDGLRGQCKSCDSNDILNNKERHALSSKNNYLKNIDYYNAWHKNNKELNLKKVKEQKRKSHLKQREVRLKRIAERKKTDNVYALRINISKLILVSIKLKGYSKQTKTYSILGCEYSFFMNYIESQFKKGMNWDNIHLDHIKPMASAKTEQEVLELNHYTNFQPLLAVDNLEKGAKLITKQLRII